MPRKDVAPRFSHHPDDALRLFPHPRRCAGERQVRSLHAFSRGSSKALSGVAQCGLLCTDVQPQSQVLFHAHQVGDRHGGKRVHRSLPDVAGQDAAYRPTTPHRSADRLYVGVQ